jgi:hypothetical protein
MSGFAGLMASYKLSIAPAAPVLRVSFALDNPACWPGSGTTITDLSGYSNNGTLVNSPTTASTTITTANNAGAPRYISVPFNLPYNKWSIRIIAQPSSTQTYWATLFGNETYNASQGFLAYLYSSTGMAYGAVAGGTNYVATIAGVKRQFDFTYDGSKFRLYFNGSNVSTSGAYGTITASTNNLYFGARHTNAGTGATDGSNTTFYLMQVWDGTLAAADILTAYNNNKTPYGI